MIANIHITEKSFGPKTLMTNIKFAIDAGEKVGVVGRNGVGKSTLFGILVGLDSDYTGDITYRRGLTVVATAQEHGDLGSQTVLQYILQGLPEYAKLSQVIETYPAIMGDNIHKITEYTSALDRFEQKGFYQIESDIERELEQFQLINVAHRTFATLSGGQKRLVEIVKVMHAQAQLALIDEPTNHMDYVAKKQFVDWMMQAPEAMLVITHDRDVLKHVDRIVELKDGSCQSYKGNYSDYLRQNAHSTGTAMHDYEMIQRQIANLKVKVTNFRRLKEKARDPDTIKQFKRRESQAMAELKELERVEKPTFWIDKTNAEHLSHKMSKNYDKYKARNIKMNIKNEESRSQHVLVSARNLSLGYDVPLFDNINIDLREGEALELRGRNGAGKSTLLKAILSPVARSLPNKSLNVEKMGDATVFGGSLALDLHVRLGVYEQEISSKYFSLTLHDAIERIYLDQNLSITETKIRQLMSDYLFTSSDSDIEVERLSGGQKARLQIIAMLANNPQLLVLDEPTNHLDLPSIEELENALARYSGAVLYVSHDDYFRKVMGGHAVQVGIIHVRK